jgi:hypothetical protein
LLPLVAVLLALKVSLLPKTKSYSFQDLWHSHVALERKKLSLLAPKNPIILTAEIGCEK